MCSVSEHLKAALPETDFAIDASHEVLRLLCTPLLRVINVMLMFLTTDHFCTIYINERDVEEKSKAVKRVLVFEAQRPIATVRFLMRQQLASPHQQRGLGERCKLV